MAKEVLSVYLRGRTTITRDVSFLRGPEPTRLVQNALADSCRMHAARPQSMRADMTVSSDFLRRSYVISKGSKSEAGNR